MGGFHITHSSRWEGRVLSFTYQSTDSPLLSTLYKPLRKHLISVLGAPTRQGVLPSGSGSSPSVQMDSPRVSVSANFRMSYEELVYLAALQRRGSSLIANLSPSF